MNKLISIKDYSKSNGISERTAYRQIEKTDIKSVKFGAERYIIRNEIDDETKEQIIEGKKQEWNNDIMRAHTIYMQQMTHTADTTRIINEILEDVAEIKKITNTDRIKGYDRRSLQMKVKSGKIERKVRNDKFTIRNRILKQDTVFRKAMELISKFWIMDPLHSLTNAIDRALMEAKKKEDYWEVVPVNFYTLRRQIQNAFIQSGLPNMHTFMNHYNEYSKKNAYVKGAFTDDIEFMQVISLDDHKFDVAGALVWNEKTGEYEQKKIYSWVCMEMKTLMILGYEIKSEPFTDSDIIRMMMKVLRKWGAPKEKVICDQGLGADNWVVTFFSKLGIVFEPQQEYSPTKKANNERIFKFFKEEIDIYNENFTGSNHPVEGRHRGLKLSPEEMTELMSEAIKRYDGYINGYYQDRPRKRNIPGIKEITDNTGRISIKDLFEHYSKTYVRKTVSDRQLRYAFLKNDYVKSFTGYYMKFKGELYIPDSEESLVIYDPSYKYIIAYNPDDLNTIDLYSAQDILDRLTGQMICKGEYVCTLNSIMVLAADEKKKAIAMYNKRIKKAQLELAKAYRERTNNIVNLAIRGDGTLVDVKKEEERAIVDVIKNAVPVEMIETAIKETKKEISFDKIEEMTLDGLENIVDV